MTSNAQSIASATDLPNELVCMLSTYMFATDIVHLLSTCRTLHVYMSEETIWRGFCANYKVDDPRVLGGDSYYQIYSAILHKYGPLIGLWAGDFPYLGSIIEFRIDAATRAIVGETWIMSTASVASTRGCPPLPRYELFVAIALEIHEDPRSPTRKSSATASLSWRIVKDDLREEMCLQSPDAPLDRFPVFHTLSETSAAAYLRHTGLGGYCTHPPFPSNAHGHIWYDAHHELPRLPLETSPEPLASTPIRNSANDEGMELTLFTAGSSYTRPKALYVGYPILGSRNHEFGDFISTTQWPLDLDIADLREVHTTPSIHGVGCSSTRYYPLRSRPRPNWSPNNVEWDPACLEGLWIGDYSAHGIEVLWLSYVSEARKVNAWKLTGDINVPRGAISWWINIDEELAEDRSPHFRDAYKNLPLVKFRSGRGTVSDVGFVHPQTVEISVAVLSSEDIRILWAGLMFGFESRYRRYPGRDPASEVAVSEFTRRARDIEDQ